MSDAIPVNTAKRKPLVFFSHGFRPFFLMAGLWASLDVGLWVLSLVGVPIPAGPLPLMRWHAHELLTGFVGAAMIGFILTAIPNWTGRPAYSGPKPVGLALLFVCAHLALLPGSPVPIRYAVALALAPLPAALLMVLPELIKARTKRLFMPPALILGFWVGDLLMLGEAADWWNVTTWATGQMLTANMALLLVGLIGGRIIQPFTLNALRKVGRPVVPSPFSVVDKAAMAAMVAVVIGDVISPDSMYSGGIAAIAAVLVALRLSRWHGLRALDQPIVWILHVAYAFVPLALATKAVWLMTGAGWAAHWLHLQTAGALTLMIVAVMTRASLGHTGRDLIAAPATAGAYFALLLAVAARVFGPGRGDGSTTPFIVAASLWITGFVLFLWVYIPILIGPHRIDRL